MRDFFVGLSWNASGISFRRVIHKTCNWGDLKHAEWVWNSSWRKLLLTRFKCTCSCQVKLNYYISRKIDPYYINFPNWSHCEFGTLPGPKPLSSYELQFDSLQPISVNGTFESVTIIFLVPQNCVRSSLCTFLSFYDNVRNISKSR